MASCQPVDYRRLHGDVGCMTKKKKTTWQRARTPKQIAVRRNSILEAAGELLDQFGLDQTGLNAIARQCDMSKANVYRYFESREAILLELLLDEQSKWANALIRRLKKITDQSIDGIGRAVATTLAQRPRFCVLVAALAGVLEHNVNYETVVQFKRQLQSQVRALSSELRSVLPALTEEEAFSVVAMIIMSASGAWPHCNPAPIVREVLSDPEFSHMRLDFKSTMYDFTVILLRGMVADH